MVPDTDDDVADIVRHLKKGGLKDPRARLRDRLTDELAALEASVKGGHRPANFERERDRLTVELRDLGTPLAAHVRDEVRRSVERVRAELDGTRGEFIERAAAAYEKSSRGKPLLRPTASDFRKAARALSKVAFTEPAQQVVHWLEGVRQEPPEHANAFHYHCAAEAYYLLQLFSKKRPTLYADGPFITTAVLLCAAAGGEATAEGMRRSCTLVRKRRCGSPRTNRT